ncbi:unnamed protein product [Mytilus coruscus]|uniref:Farnesoic acid O-methyl transferase domain-containing protein n=1 Tax=Mytilus coruscus TaxID=42192 RepID=A0A6J8DTA9_MYTCO|nr:unnamed protein product [Mytilus coruscus]
MIMTGTFVALLTITALGNLLDDVRIKTQNSGGVGLWTPNIEDYYTNLSTFQIFLADRYIKFYVKACDNAFVLLSAATNLQSDSYAICIGGQGNSKIFLRVRRNGAVTSISFPESGILSCSEFKVFEVNWEESGRITLMSDRGTVMNWTDTTPIQIQGLGIMTGWGSEGLWILKHSSLFTGYYCGESDTYGNMTLLSTTVQRSRVTCTLKCSTRNDCLGVNFNGNTNTCEVVAGGQPVVKSVVHNWKFYSKCLHENKACLACIV